MTKKEVLMVNPVNAQYAHGDKLIHKRTKHRLAPICASDDGMVICVYDKTSNRTYISLARDVAYEPGHEPAKMSTEATDETYGQINPSGRG